MNKKKIINDPVYGFIHLPYDVVYDIIEHPIFQRLRRIQQLGFSNLVYPGATHTRFHHSIGAMRLMVRALDVLKKKQIDITEQEEKATIIAILLHDVGHGPYSHALESTLVHHVHHEEISILLMKELEKTFPEDISLALQIFDGTYKKNFLHQLVSGQLDMDRMDYLNRDSFYTGVSEGVIGYDRIINMLDVVDDKIVVEEKGIYSIEKFLVARRLMYWQVYLHKTVLCAEMLLKNIFSYIRNDNIVIPLDTPINYFLSKEFDKKDTATWLPLFCTLDDTDIIFVLKYLSNNSKDKILKTISDALIYRKLFHVEFNEKNNIEEKYLALQKKYDPKEFKYLVHKGSTSNNMYNTEKNNIYIKLKNNKLVDIASITEQWNIDSLANPVLKHYIIYPR